MTGWGDVTLTAVVAAGDVTQLYPPFVSAGAATNNAGDLKRQPCEGTLVNLQVETDGTNGGEITIYDINGADVGADVNTGTTITNAQLVAAVAANLCRTVYSQKFVGTEGARLAIAHGTPIMRGLAGRFTNAGPTGSIELNIVADGLFRKVQVTG